MDALHPGETLVNSTLVPHPAGVLHATRPWATVLLAQGRGAGILAPPILKGYNLSPWYQLLHKGLFS